MASDDPPMLEYGSPPLRRERRLWRWLVPVLSGAGAGYLLSFSAYGWFCSAIIAGFFIGTLSAVFAPKRKFVSGLLGNGVAVIVTFAMATINNWKSGLPLSLSDFPVFIPMLAAILIVPGMVGAAAVSVVSSATNPSL